MQSADENVEALVTKAEAEWMKRYETGPSRLRWTELPVQVGDDAPDAELADLNGEMRSLSGFWAEQPTIVMFWRHFGCNCGIERAERLATEYGDYRDAGAEVVVVTQAEPARSAEYAERRGIECPVLCDPGRETYDAFGLLDYDLPQVFQGAPDEFLALDPEAGAGLAADRREMGQNMVDNPWQQAGEFLVDTDGHIQVSHRYQYCEDYPDPGVFLTALRMLE
ncbi:MULTISPECIES: peroxiredoxin-like family protein [Haloferax]|uniref:Redoxin domain-containing protein n=2 Tax=Haloferax TaxID=2251 RepID=A0A6G1YYQ8_9EURY|nr:MULTISPECIES: peroxiredoxin-like family protein [Haloferax]KAB1186706.1 AhpC/TSA family protein [Haloferax sp. CBA1149]MRW79328.1 redoxin domain-containing protein [Haloferax marinisediminis]